MSITKSEVDKNLFLIAKDSQSSVIEMVASPANFQIGLTNSPADLTLMGRLSLSSRVYYATKQNAYNIMLDGDVSIALISIEIRNVARVTLPAGPREGQVIFVKDRDGVCSSAAMVISSDEGTIDGASTTTINSDYGKKCFCWNTDRWSIIS